MAFPVVDPRIQAGIEVYPRWDIAHIEGAVAPSPSWKSTRRSLFMTTVSESLDPWFFEDIELRCETSSEKLLAEADLYRNRNSR